MSNFAGGDMSDETIRRPRVALCLLVRDAVASLRDCIESVRPLVDEWIITDTGSVDGSLALLAELLPGVSVAREAWEDDFAAARNQLLARATADWILMLDADERLPPASLAPLAAQFAALPQGPLGLRCRVVDYDPEGQPVFWRERISVLARDPRLYYSGRAHEHPLLRGGELPVSQEPGIVIAHQVPAAEIGRAKSARYAQLLALAGSQASAPIARYHLLMQGLTQGQIEPGPGLERLEALCAETAAGLAAPPSPDWVGVPLREALGHLLALSAACEPPRRTLERGARWRDELCDSESLQLLARCHEALNEPEAARRLWFESLHPGLSMLGPEAGSEPLLALGRLAQAEGDPLAAAAWRWQAIAAGAVPRGQLPPLDEVANRLILKLRERLRAHDPRGLLAVASQLLPLAPLPEPFALSCGAARRLGLDGLAAVLARLGALLWPGERLLAGFARLDWEQVGGVQPSDCRLLRLAASEPGSLLQQAPPGWACRDPWPQRGWSLERAASLSPEEAAALDELLAYRPFYPGPLLIEASAGALHLWPAGLAQSAPGIGLNWTNSGAQPPAEAADAEAGLGLDFGQALQAVLGPIFAQGPDPGSGSGSGPNFGRGLGFGSGFGSGFGPGSG